MINKNANWFKYDENRIRRRQMPEPYSNIWIGSDPTDGMTKETADSFDAIINVSCTECAFFYPSNPKQKMYWYPINESGHWGYGVFFFTKKILDFHHKKGDKIYLHCHAGIHRSPTIFIWWLVSQGHSVEEAICIELGSKATPERIKELQEEEYFDYKIWSDRDEGIIPYKLEKMYKRMQKKQDMSLAEVLLHGGPIDRSIEVLCMGHQVRVEHLRRMRYWSNIKQIIKWIVTYYDRRKKGLVVVKHSDCVQTICKKEDAERVTQDWTAHRAEWMNKHIEDNKKLRAMWDAYDKRNPS